MDFSKNIGVIPDFFHDLIAYILPGMLSIMLIVLDYSVIVNDFDLSKLNISILESIWLIVLAYIFGKIYSYIGYIYIHSRNYFFIKINKPKWSLLFDENDESYTQAFKDNLKTKLKEWLSNQNGEKIIVEAESEKKDDYFNLLLFYFRERYPAIALYEKKQNSNIILARSCSVIFLINIMFYHIILFIVGFEKLSFSFNSTLVMVLSILLSVIFYNKLRLEQRYLAMYIFECFIGLKKTLKSVKNKNASNK